MPGVAQLGGSLVLVKVDKRELELLYKKCKYFTPCEHFETQVILFSLEFISMSTAGAIFSSVYIFVVS